MLAGSWTGCVTGQRAASADVRWRLVPDGTTPDDAAETVAPATALGEAVATPFAPLAEGVAPLGTAVPHAAASAAAATPTVTRRAIHPIADFTVPSSLWQERGPRAIPIVLLFRPT